MNIYYKVESDSLFVFAPLNCEAWHEPTSAASIPLKTIKLDEIAMDSLLLAGDVKVFEWK